LAGTCAEVMKRDIVLSLTRACAGYSDRPVLVDIDLEVRAGDRLAIMGRSGAGKSTLLGLLYAQRPEAIALIPQAAALVRPLPVFHNVYMGRLDRNSTLANLRTLISPRRIDREEIGQVLADVGLADKMFEKAGALSGGQQQRTSVARALYNGRPILLGDEPVSALDRVQGAEVFALMARRHETVVAAMHDVGLARELCDRIVVLEDGRKIIDAPSADLTARDLLGHFGAAK
jgi:phosphonate transport system ATP-binding protein